MRRRLFLASAASTTLLSACASRPQLGRRRLALVIGNNEYSKGGWGSLKKPVSDANALADHFASFNFEDIEGGVTGVRAKTDLDLKQMSEAVDAFRKRIDENTYSDALFYFAGHGIRLEDDENYLVPRGADFADRRNRRKLMRLLDVAKIVGRAPGGGLMFIDACRRKGGGLARVGLPDSADGKARAEEGLDFKVHSPTLDEEKQARDVFIGYSAAPGEIAFDGNETDEHSPFATALLRHLGTKRDSDLLDDFERVKRDVLAQTGTFQEPSSYAGFGQANKFYFGARTVG